MQGYQSGSERAARVGWREMMGKVTESIFSGDTYIIPLAEVLFIVRDKREGFKDRITVVFKGSTWSNETDYYNNIAYIIGAEAENFITAWCRYRAGLESETVVNIYEEK